jgi:hypothetical protein
MYPVLFFPVFACASPFNAQVRKMKRIFRELGYYPTLVEVQKKDALGRLLARMSVAC